MRPIVQWFCNRTWETCYSRCSIKRPRYSFNRDPTPSKHILFLMLWLGPLVLQPIASEKTCLIPIWKLFEWQCHGMDPCLPPTSKTQAPSLATPLGVYIWYLPRKFMNHIYSDTSSSINLSQTSLQTYFIATKPLRTWQPRPKHHRGAGFPIVASKEAPENAGKPAANEGILLQPQ